MTPGAARAAPRPRRRTTAGCTARPAPTRSSARRRRARRAAAAAGRCAVRRRPTAPRGPSPGTAGVRRASTTTSAAATTTASAPMSGRDVPRPSQESSDPSARCHGVPRETNREARRTWSSACGPARARAGRVTSAAPATTRAAAARSRRSGHTSATAYSAIVSFTDADAPTSAPAASGDRRTAASAAIPSATASASTCAPATSAHRTSGFRPHSRTVRARAASPRDSRRSSSPTPMTQAAFTTDSRRTVPRTDVPARRAGERLLGRRERPVDRRRALPRRLHRRRDRVGAAAEVLRRHDVRVRRPPPRCGRTPRS